jgi:hypothetical protein
MTQPTPPRHHNSFAIPRHSRRHGAMTMDISWTSDWPLVPWSVRGHDELFVLVDDLEEQLRRFREEGPRPEDLRDAEAAHGHLVIVSGDEGVGKTSLIHYCVNDLVTRLRGPEDPPAAGPGPWADVRLPRNVKILDVAGKLNVEDTLIYRNGKLAGIEDINRNICDKALDILKGDVDDRFLQACELPGHQDLSAPVLEVRYRALGRLLMDLGWTALVIVPNIKWMDRDLSRRFLRSCASYSVPGIVFFLESTNSKMQELVADEFSELEMRRVVTHLTIGRLRTSDCAAFVQKRIEVAGSYVNDHVSVADDAVYGYRTSVDYGCVRNLQLIFHGVAEEARQDGVGVIDMDRLRNYQNRRRAIPDNFTRAPRTGADG